MLCSESSCHVIQTQDKRFHSVEDAMEVRIDYMRVAPEAFKAMSALEQYLHQSTLGAELVDLIKLRVSQINGCAYCIDMHWKDLRALGESEQRLYGLDAWEESPYYTSRERAALAWAEAVTNVRDGHVPDAVHQATRKEFGERELVDLTMAVTTINAWNRLAIAGRIEPGKYQSRLKSERKIA
jgi:AhpD family alkylhydroperoxidase